MARVDLSQRGTVIIAASGGFAVVATLMAAVVVLLFPMKTVSGQVVDSTSGRPVVGAVVRAAGGEFRVDGNGAFSLPGVRFGTGVVVDARGYQSATSIVALGDRLQMALAPWVMEGAVIDSVGGKPVAGAQLSAGSMEAKSDEQGKFRLTGIEPGTEVVARAEGFAQLAVKYEGQPVANLKLKPNVLTLKAVNLSTNQPIEGVEASDGHSSARTDRQGQLRLQYLRSGAEVVVRLEGFAPAKLTYSGQESVEVRLRSDTITGTVKDSSDKPIARASVSDGNSTVSTDEQGAFKLTGVGENAQLSVSANGYERRQLPVGEQSTLDVSLKPFSARGLYLTFYGVGADELRDHVLELADKTEINSVVIDIKGDRGWIAYRSSVPMVQQIGAQQEIMIKDPKSFLADLRKRGVYSIARIVTFKDNPLATAMPELSVMNSSTGRPWVDNEGLRWADPTRQEVWDYNIALAVEAIENGFDEVQFDYVRFPTDASAGNSLSSVAFSQANTMENRMAAINGFLEKAKQAIKAKGGNLSADIFGYVVWRTDDMGIGQKLEELAEHVDFVSPMVYPNLFWDGIAVEGGVKYANQQAGLYPYEIVYESMKVAAQRIGAAKLRPWLEYYNDYLTGKTYTAADMEAQKKASYENGITGWLFWDPSNRFDKGGFGPEQ